MDFTFDLSEDQRALRTTLREFAEAEIAPRAGEWDRTSTFPAASISLGGAPILQFGTEQQKQRWLVPLARGETIGAFASTEPGMGSDVQGLETRATQDNGQWVINGTKAYI